MKLYVLKMHLRDARSSIRGLLACGPLVCLRLALSVVAGLLGAVGLVALLLAALGLLIPVAAAVILCLGLALMAWPFAKAPKATEAA